jgi:hypothetical protein
MDDERFAKFTTDPKFRTAPKREKKLKIDPRFQHVFTDKRFDNKKLGVDKRGRPKSYGSKESYEQYYRVKSSDDDSSSEEDASSMQITAKSLKRKVEEKNKRREEKKNTQNTEKYAIANSKKHKKENDKQKRENMVSGEVDFARGEGPLLSDSSSEESSEEEEKQEDKYDGFDKWGELDHDAETIQTGDETNRLAVCNLDWDRVCATDIYVALSSFSASTTFLTGTHNEKSGLKSVNIYLSEFGRTRLEEEDRLGPLELRQSGSTEGATTNSANAEDDDIIEDDELEVGDDNYEENEKKAMERVRKYQVNRLRYYYAVAEFWKVEDADHAYKNCDGAEYELSGTRFDLRFIPDDTRFLEQPTDICTEMPNPDAYKPKSFLNTALGQGKVNLTWDETDPEREAAMKRAFDLTDKNDEDEDITAYLAQSSSDDEETQPDPHSNDLERTHGTIQDGDMEMNFAASEAHEDKLQINGSSSITEAENMAPWDKYLHKKKEKQKMKRESRRLANQIEQEPCDSKDSMTKSKQKKKSRHEEVKSDQTNDLSLLVMDSDDDKQHFDYKEIVKKESKKSKKLKRRLEKAKSEMEENFKVDLDDERFSAVFQSADYNVDPSHPNFKTTQSMLDIVAEKQRRVHKRGKGKRTKQPELNDNRTGVKNNDIEETPSDTQVFDSAVYKD